MELEHNCVIVISGVAASLEPEAPLRDQQLEVTGRHEKIIERLWQVVLESLPSNVRMIGGEPERNDVTVNQPFVLRFPLRLVLTGNSPQQLEGMGQVFNHDLMHEIGAKIMQTYYETIRNVWVNTPEVQEVIDAYLTMKHADQEKVQSQLKEEDFMAAMTARLIAEEQRREAEAKQRMTQKNDSDIPEWTE